MKMRTDIPTGRKYRIVVKYLAALLDLPGAWTTDGVYLRHKETGIVLWRYDGWLKLYIEEPAYLEFRLYDRWRLWHKAQAVFTALQNARRDSALNAIGERLIK